MQFKIPQDVQRADTIIGSITFAQLGISLVGGAIAYAVYMGLATTYYWYVWAIPVAIILIVTASFAFLKIDDMTFTRFLLYFTEFVVKPKLRYFTKVDNYYYSVLKQPINIAGGTAEATKLSEEELSAKRKKLEEVSKMLDV